MDVEDLWGCSVHTGKHLSSSSSSSSMQASKFYSGGGDDIWEYFPCPFCYVDVEVPVLCTHLQEEHCFDMKNAGCPVCAANLGKDMIGHFTVQHSHLLKRRKSQRTSLWASSPATVEKELYAVSSFLGAASTNRRGNASDSAPDPLLSSFIYNISFPDSKSDQEANSDTAGRGASSLHVQSLEPSISNQVLEQDYEERSQRAEFVQQMLLSTIF